MAVLDVLRTLAVMLVFSGHFRTDFQALSWDKNPLVYYSWTGVDLFFVLSGFLIGSQLWKELQRDGRIRIGRFLMRRGLRIWPLYFGFVALVIAEVFLAGHRSSGLWADILFLSNYFPGQIGGGWSLSTEEQFYILAPVCISVMSLLMKPRRLWIVPAAGLAVPVICRIAVVRSSTLSFRDLQQFLYYPSHTHSDGLAVGLLIAWVAVFYPGFGLQPRRWLALAFGMLVLGGGLYGVNRLAFNFTTVGLIGGAAVCWAIVKPGNGTPVVNSRVFYIMSRLSYGIYLNHFGVLGGLQLPLQSWYRDGSQAGLICCYVFSLGVSIAVATATFFLIEHPFLVLRSKWLTRERMPAPAVAV